MTESRLPTTAVARPGTWKRWRFPLLFGSGLLFMPTLALVREIIAANGCAATGGSYDYLRALCYMSGTRATENGFHVPLAWVGLFLFAKIGAVLLFGLNSAARRPLVAFSLAVVAFAVAGRKVLLRPLRSSWGAPA